MRRIASRELGRMGCALLLALALPLAVSAAVIDVRTSASLSSGLIRLEDVADVEEFDPQLRKQLAAVTLGPAPGPGRKTRITQQIIRERLLAHGINLTDIEFTGQSVIVIDGPAETRPKPGAKPVHAPRPVPVRPAAVSPAQRSKVERSIQEAFHKHYHSAASDIGPLSLHVELEDRDVSRMLQVPVDSIRFLEAGLEWGGPQTLTAQFSQAEGTTEIVRMQAWLNESPKLMTVKHSVPKGKVIQESDLVSAAARVGQTGFATAEELIGQETTRPLRPGAPVQPGDLSKVSLIRSNDLVTVKVRSPGLTVSRIFRAQSSGSEGELVNLVSLDDSRDKVQARVTGWHEAEIVVSTGAVPAPEAEPPTRRGRSAGSESVRSRGGRS